MVKHYCHTHMTEHKASHWVVDGDKWYCKSISLFLEDVIQTNAMREQNKNVDAEEGAKLVQELMEDLK